MYLNSTFNYETFPHRLLLLKSMVANVYYSYLLGKPETSYKPFLCNKIKGNSI